MPGYMTLKERGKIESFRRIGEDLKLGRVVINLDKCKGCEYCTHACPAGVLEIVDKKCRMVMELPFCFSCGDCTAICPEGAIELVEFIEFKRYFKYLDRGEPLPPRRF